MLADGRLHRFARRGRLNPRRLGAGRGFGGLPGRPDRSLHGSHGRLEALEPGDRVPDGLTRDRCHLLGLTSRLGRGRATDRLLGDGPALGLGEGLQRGLACASNLCEENFSELGELLARERLRGSRRSPRSGVDPRGGVDRPARPAHRRAQRAPEARGRPGVHFHYSVDLRARGGDGACVEKKKHWDLPELRGGFDGSSDVDAGHAGRLHVRVDEDEIDRGVAHDTQDLKSRLDGDQFPSVPLAERFQHRAGRDDRVGDEDPYRAVA